MSVTLSQMLFELRDACNESQEDVAEAVGITRVAYTRYENGQRKPETEIAIKSAQHFGVTVEQLYGYDGMISYKQTKKPTVMDDGQRVNILVDLSPEELQRVVDFVAGIKAARPKDASRQG